MFQTFHEEKLGIIIIGEVNVLQIWFLKLFEIHFELSIKEGKNTCFLFQNAAVLGIKFGKQNIDIVSYRLEIIYKIYHS